MANESLILQANGNNGRQVGGMLAYRPSLDKGIIPIEFPFTRTTSGMERLSDGLWRDAAINLPRRYWDGTKYSYLFEPARTNLCTNSHDLNTWSKGGGATTNDNIISSPFVGYLADRLNVSNSAYVFRGSIPVANSTTYTLSGFVKNDTLTAGENIRCILTNNANTPNNFNMSINIDINAGTATYTVAGTATTGFVSGSNSGTLTNVGDGWFYFTITVTTGTGAVSAVGSIEWYSPSGAKSYYAIGVQLEAASSATSPIITAGSAVLRAADAPALVGINNLITRTATLYWEINITAPINKGIVGLASLNSGLDFVRFRLNLTTIQNEWWVGGGFINQSSGSIVSLGINKIIFSFSENGTIKIFRNGVKDLEIAVGTLFTPTTLNLCSVSGAQQLINPLNEFKLWNTQLSDAECIALTTL